jgi:uncharacterized damage-inducible protein DinB
MITFNTTYFETYTKLVTQASMAEAFAAQDEYWNNFLTTITEEKSQYAYAENKWSIKEVLQHIIDTERIFAYRALSIARKETVTLPGFDENDYAANSNADERTWADLVEELKTVRQSTIWLYKSLSTEALQHIGKFSKAEGTPELLIKIIIGHFYHHANVINEKYLG